MSTILNTSRDRVDKYVTRQGKLPRCVNHTPHKSPEYQDMSTIFTLIARVSRYVNILHTNKARVPRHVNHTTHTSRQSAKVFNRLVKVLR